MDDSTTSSERDRDERLRYVFELLLDLLFFRRGGRNVGHAGIYLGEGKMIHASNHRYGVTVTDLRQPYYEGTFEVAKRVFEVKYPH